MDKIKRFFSRLFPPKWVDMDIYAEPGTILKYTNFSEGGMKWGSNDDPRECLAMGEKYILDHTEIHSWHTKVYLVGISNKRFSSVHFSQHKNGKGARPK